MRPLRSKCFDSSLSFRASCVPDRHSHDLHSATVGQGRCLIDRPRRSSSFRKELSDECIDRRNVGQVDEGNVDEYDVIARESSRAQGRKNVAKRQLRLFTRCTGMKNTRRVDRELTTDVTMVAGHHRLADRRRSRGQTGPALDETMWHLPGALEATRRSARASTRSEWLDRASPAPSSTC